MASGSKEEDGGFGDPAPFDISPMLEWCNSNGVYFVVPKLHGESIKTVLKAHEPSQEDIMKFNIVTSQCGEFPERTHEINVSCPLCGTCEGYGFAWILIRFIVAPLDEHLTLTTMGLFLSMHPHLVRFAMATPEPIHIAAWYGNIGSVMALMQAGANVNAITFFHPKEMNIEHKRAYNGVVFLCSLPSKRPVRRHGHWTPLDLAIERGDSDIIRFLNGYKGRRSVEANTAKLYSAFWEWAKNCERAEHNET